MTLDAQKGLGELTSSLVVLLRTEFVALPSDALYRALSDLITGTATGSHDDLTRGFVSAAGNLIRDEFAHLDAMQITNALGLVAQEVDRLERLGDRALPAPPIPKPEPIAERLGSSAPRYVRGDNWSYLLTWSSADARVGMQFESEDQCSHFCESIVRDQKFVCELDDPPARFAAVAFELSYMDGSETLSFGAGVVERGPGAKVTFAVQHVPAAVRQAAARRRYRISASHGVVDAPLPSSSGNPERASGSHVSPTTRPVAAGPYDGPQHRADTDPDDFARIPTGLERSGAHSAGHVDLNTAARRRQRAQARVRAHTQTGSTARVIEDELTRFGRRTGRRDESGVVETVAPNSPGPASSGPDEALTPASGNEALTPASGNEALTPISGNEALTPTSGASHLSGRGARIAAREKLAAERASGNYASVSTGVRPITRDTSPPSEPGQPFGERRRSESHTRPQAVVPPTTAATRPPRVGEPAPNANRDRVRPASVSAMLPSAADSELELGALVSRKDGATVDGGAAALVLLAAGGSPAAILDIATPEHRWTLGMREDLLLDIHTNPEDPQFSFEHSLALSGMVESGPLAEAVRVAGERDRPLAEILVEMRLLRFREIDAITTARNQLMLKHLFDEAILSFEIRGYESMRSASSTQMSVAPIAWAWLRDACADLSQDVLEGLMAGHDMDRPSFVHDAFIGPSALRLSTRERRFVEEVLDGKVSVTQGLARSPLRRRPSLGLLVALERAGLISWERMQTASTRIARSWDAILAKKRDIGNMNRFDLLEAHWSSDGVLVQEAYASEVRTLDLDYVMRNGTEEQQALATSVRDGLLAARDYLQDRAARRDERDKAIDDFNRRTAVHLYEKQAELALFKADFAAAVDSLRRVVELQPKHATARAQLETILAHSQR